MKCTKCGLDLPSGVKNCPRCGTYAEIENAVSGQPKRVKPIIYAIGALAIVAVLALVVAFAMRGGKQNVAIAPSTAPGPPADITSAPSPGLGDGELMTAPPPAPGPAAPSAPGVTKPKPPKDLVEYLAFVKKVEEHRQMLLRDTGVALGLATAGGATQSLLDLIDMAADPDGEKAQDPLATQKKELARQYKNWLSTLEYFDKRPAPASAREFAGAYREVLFREAKAVGEIAVAMHNVDVTDSADLSKVLSTLQKMKRDPSIQSNIDKAADSADAKLTQLVSKYDMEKPFSVPREEQTSGSIMGF